jgi:hypothetical protein
MPDNVPPECAEGAVEVRTRRCVSGVWVEGWTAGSEFGGVLSLPAAAPCNGCEKKVEMVMDLAAKGWKPADIEKVLKAL